MVQMFFTVPYTLGKENVFIMRILPQFQVMATFKSTYKMFAFLKKFLKIIYRFLPETHLYYANNHSKNIFMV
jgi:hypothetical protein